jgi:hypothetical protein
MPTLLTLQRAWVVEAVIIKHRAGAVIMLVMAEGMEVMELP